MLRPAPTLQWALWQWSGTACGERVGFRRSVLEAMSGIMQCRTGALGMRAYECPEHGEELVPSSCRRRDCPGCVGDRSFKWCAAVEARLLACDHFHVVFTLTGRLVPYWRHNRALMADLLFDAASTTLKRLLADHKYMGGTPAMLGVLHTHGSALTLHPHVHLLVSAVGLGPAGALARARKPETLLPYRVVRRAFQVEFLHGLARLADDPDFHLPRGTTAPQLRKLICDLFAESHKQWNVMIFLRKDARPVVRYLSRTVFGGPIRDGRIVEVTERSVTFRYNDWRGHEEGGGAPPEREMQLHLSDFVRRWTEHVAEPGFKTVRNWGLFAPGQQSRLDRARELLGQAPSPVAPEPAGTGDAEPEPTVRCRKCSAPMVVRELPPALIALSPAARAVLRTRASPFFARVAA